jgi:hypothetical protein
MAAASILLLLFAAPPPAAPAAQAAAMLTYEEMTQVAPRCRQRAGADILVCGRRDADRYRVPFLAATPGDPRRLGVHEERATWLRRPDNCEEMSAFLVGCGSFGVSVSTNLGSGKAEVVRPLAP